MIFDVNRGDVFVLAGLVAVLCAGCGGRGRPSPLPAPARVRVSGPLTVRVVSDGRVETIPLERYVRGTVEAESWVPRNEAPEVAERVYELQALIARTYVAANLGRHRAAGADVCDTTHCQVYRAPDDTHVHHDRLDAALARSAGRILLYDDAPILALFHASCGGATSAADEVWGGRSRPYLRSVDDPSCERAAMPWRIRLDRPALVRALDADVRTRVGARLDAVDVVTRDAADRAVLIALTGERSPVVRGEELRGVLVRAFGPRSVRSTRFHVTRDGEAFVFEGTGFGHGAGLCQAGALSRLRAGASVGEVIAHFYPGVSIGIGSPSETMGLLIPSLREAPLRSDRADR
jgi:stage II sporulation protein D